MDECNFKVAAQQRGFTLDGKMIGFDTMVGYILAQLEKGNIKQTAVQDRYILNTVTD